MTRNELENPCEFCHKQENKIEREYPTDSEETYLLCKPCAEKDICNRCEYSQPVRKRVGCATLASVK